MKREKIQVKFWREKIQEKLWREKIEVMNIMKSLLQI